MTTQETIDQAAKIALDGDGTVIVGRQAAQALSDAGLLVSDAKDVMYLNHKLTEARDTIQRLNRRAQLAEAALHKQLHHPNGAQDPTVNALGERVREMEAERNTALGKVDEYRQRLSRARHDIEYQKQLRRDVEAEHADCTADLAIAEAQRDTARATIQRVRGVANRRDVIYPPKFRFGAAENYVLGVHHTRQAIRAAIEGGNRAQVQKAAINELANGTGKGKSNPVAREIWERCQENHDQYHDRSCEMAARLRAERDAALATIQRVRDLHQPHPANCSCHARRWDGSCFYAGTCDSCHCGTPCPTIRALDQEEA